ncbi:hypothetical protein MRB53_014874 [Persea americana]|uniref:Uncharacterized protein n=1 Tax=Persea americana TaxID=3435 RepID=A0ACC2KCP1_PERAE|nr:hypothetical protein MRB53_014874 [Persea americana]
MEKGLCRVLEVFKLNNQIRLPCDPKNPSLFRCNDPDFPVSAFHVVVFSDNTEALSTRGGDDSEEIIRRLAEWHDGSAKPAVIPFSGSYDDGHNSLAPPVEIIT